MPQAKDGGRDVLRSHAFVSFAAGKRRKCRGFRAARAFFDRGANSTNRGANSTNRGANSANRGANSTNRGANSTIWVTPSVSLRSKAPSKREPIIPPSAWRLTAPFTQGGLLLHCLPCVKGGGAAHAATEGLSHPLSRWTPRSTWSFPRRRR